MPISAPLDEAAVRAALRPHGESVMLPAAAYTSDEVLAWERRHLFAGAWTCLGRKEELTEGTHKAVTIGDVAVLLTFENGTVRAFANVCRHRGHELLPQEGVGNRRAVVCPYHGWAYQLDGSLRTAPGMTELPKDHGLVELGAREWNGWVFVNAYGTPPAFEHYLGGMAQLIDPYQPGELKLKARHEYDIQANWKVIVENYHECYHCPLIHPELCRVSPPTSGDNWDLPGAFVGGSMDLRDQAETMSLDGRSNGTFLEGVDRRSIRYVSLFPNLLVSAHPDYVMTHRLVPKTTNQTYVECSWYMPADVDDPTYAVEFWDVTNREDWAACESVQRGLESPHFRPGPLAPNEDAVYQWVALLASSYLDPSAALDNSVRMSSQA
ncbi:aromatic ring-hydroxylating oxygenase subunit alpha [Tenggerimyces flavus]|uniref:Aromatic ring-hydroxylating dioxygenase subunit alpha n=1 Tax=Tenggerimyces flavus TaxID=1708749 RepID=A0ABV7YA49_9ACTN|nr:aromatic ring-hydroxylating dioxygenase subunit alpha [Tenggerimyces flavus]MBM7783519.1 Rieske 2Fe-2S family protein [Tenggerimyces flavus]